MTTPSTSAETGERPQIMGVLNVTPDSFSDGGEFAKQEAAIDRAVAMVAAGADLIDVGGESTKPGAGRVSVAEEQRRVLPVVRELADRGIRVSIDTMNAATALAAVEHGATMINDVSGGLADSAMGRVAADTGVDFVVMHWRGHSDTMQQRAVYDDVVAEVTRELTQRAAELVVTGVHPDRLIVDPGLGFAKLKDHSWLMLAHLRELTEFGRVLVGASRKGFLSTLQPADAGSPRERDRASAIVAALAAEAGAWAVRVHDVQRTRAALELWSRLGAPDA